MNELLRIMAAEAVVPGVLKVTWNDGYAGVVDLRGVLTKGEMFAPLRDPERFAAVKVGEFGHSIFWGEPDNEDVDFGADRLRQIAEEQAALIRRAS